VSEFVRKSGPRIAHRDICHPLRALFVLLLLLISLSVGLSSANAGPIQNGPAISPGLGLTFAIADFDGDRGLDLASVQTGRSASGSSTYWIQFQLSASGRQSVQLVAPAGGLGIEARDVNGDHAIDLIFTSAWLRKPVAILLNDGHGKFLRAEPTAFPAAFDESGTSWVAGLRLHADFVALPPQSRIGVDRANNNQLHHQCSAEALPSSAPKFSITTVLLISAGRAPPSAVARL
jgi:hypothetical protein